jgi:hypothetical protein
MVLMTSEPYEGQLRSVALTDESRRVAGGALTDALLEAVENVAHHLADHVNGTPVALADARWWTREAGRIADALDALDPPGWHKPIPRTSEGGSDAA